MFTKMILALQEKFRLHKRVDISEHFYLYYTITTTIILHPLLPTSFLFYLIVALKGIVSVFWEVHFCRILHFVRQIFQNLPSSSFIK